MKSSVIKMTMVLAGMSIVASQAEAQLSGYYKILARHTGKAMTVQSASTNNSANIFQWTYGGSNTNDEWEIRSIGSGYYRLINRNSGKDAVVQSASTSEGANIFQYTYGGTATNDEWAVVSLGTGYYRITNRNSGKSAEVVGGGTTDGTNIAQRTYSGATYQQWQIVSLGGSATPTPRPTATPSGTWKKANLTNFTSYPDPGSDECIKYNGCQWAGQFAFVSGTMSESWVQSHNIIAVHEKDAATYKLKTFHLRQGTHAIDATVYDECSDSDCSGCCTANAQQNGLNFLIDIEKYTMQRFGSGEGIVDWQVAN